MTASGTVYVCNTCGWEYDPAVGDPDGGIPPGTSWADIPDDWACPVCGAGKEDFEPVVAPSEEASAKVKATMDAAASPLVIVGTGLAGYSLAKELRKLDAGLPLMLITADGGEAYTKPMLSNALARQQRPEDLVQKEAAAMAAELDARVLTRARVVAINRSTRELELESDDGRSTLAYDRLVLALGADPRVFPVPGSDAVGIATVNDLDDYRSWRSRIGDGGRILLIGAGLIGCEFANDLVTAGFSVALVDPAPWPLARLLPEAIGNMLVDVLTVAGCALHMGRTVARYSTAESGFLAELDDGTRVAFEHVLSAVGLTPRTTLARDAGLEVDAGILVDRLLRSSDPNIYALGDCAQTAAGPLPFIAPLLAEARALAATLSGKETPLQLPALPVVVKTPALPLVVCPPQPGIDGSWEVELREGGASAIFRDTSGTETGFVLAGNTIDQQPVLARRMPELLPQEGRLQPTTGIQTTPAGQYECTVCSYVYDPTEGDPDGGIPPGTPWADIPDDWVCPVCGAGKSDFFPIG